MSKGFSLIELLIVMTFVTVISVTITSVYIIGMTTYQGELATSTVQSNGQTILDALTLDIKNGVLIEPTYDTYATGPTSIIIRIPAIDSNKNIIYSGSDMVFDRIVYYYTGSSIHNIIIADNQSSRYAKSGHDTVLDKNILTLSFEYDPDQSSATLVKVNISSDVKTGNETRRIQLSGQARLRNHI